MSKALVLNCDEENIKRPEEKEKQNLFAGLQKNPTKNIISLLIKNKNIVFITLGLLTIIIPKECVAAVLNQNELPLKQEILETAKKPVGSLVSYLRSYGSIKSWVKFVKNGRTEEFNYYLLPTLKKVKPFIIFGSGVVMTKFVYEKVLDYEADLCATVTSNLRTDIKMLELLLKIKNVKK